MQKNYYIHHLFSTSQKNQVLYESEQKFWEKFVKQFVEENDKKFNTEQQAVFNLNDRKEEGKVIHNRKKE